MSLVVAVMGCWAAANGQVVETFVTGLLQQYPEARLLDIYKSSFQDYMGAEHLVGDTVSARQYLEYELSTTNAEDLMPWYYEPCGTEGNYVRVSLRGVYEGRIPADKLLAAFVESSKSDRRSVESWKERWHEMLSVIDSMEFELPHYQEDRQFIEEVLEKGKYAISHSPEYREAYAPHYRIVRKDLFEQELLPLLK